jgi:hypothetical protein
MPRTHPKPESGGLLFWRPSEMAAGRAVDRVLTAILPHIRAAARERDEAPVLLSELLRHPPERRELLVCNSQRFRNLPLSGLLLQRSRRDSAADPREGERLALLALALVESLDPSWYGERVLADARGRCWRVAGNVRRVASDVQGAENAFRQAEAALSRGTGDLLEKARLRACKARLWRRVRKFRRPRLSAARRRAARPPRPPAARTPRR